MQSPVSYAMYITGWANSPSMLLLGEVIRYIATMRASGCFRRTFMVLPCHIFGTTLAYSRMGQPPLHRHARAHSRGPTLDQLQHPLLVACRRAVRAHVGCAGPDRHLDLQQQALGLDQPLALLVNGVQWLGQR